jgi:hypothetical protein
MKNKRRIFILEDDPVFLLRITEGLKMSEWGKDIDILSFSRTEIDQLIINLMSHKALELIPDRIDLFIIDACLIDGTRDETGLKLLKELKENYSSDIQYIVVTQWDPSEFKTNIAFDRFVNKNIYAGYELKYRFRDIINKLWER